MSYKDLDIYKISLETFLRIHLTSLKLPQYEMFALASQIRRSSDSVNSNIVKGYGRRIYKNEYIRYLYFPIQVI